MKSFIISILLAISINSAFSQTVTNGKYYREPEEVPFHVKKMQEKADALAREQQLNVRAAEDVMVEKEVLQESEISPPVIEAPKQTISMREVQQIQPPVQEIKVAPPTTEQPKVQQTQYVPGDFDRQMMFYGGALLLVFVLSIAAHEYATYFYNGQDFILSTLLSYLVLFKFKDEMLLSISAIIIAHFIAGLVINKFNLGKALVSTIGRLAGLLVFFITVLMSLFFMAIQKFQPSQTDTVESIARKKQTERNANIVGIAASGTVSYLIYKYFIDNSNVEKYNQGEE